MTFKFRCGNCKRKRSFKILKRDDLAKNIIEQLSFHINHTTVFIITVHHVIKRHQDINYTNILHESQECIDMMRHIIKNDTEFIFESDSDEVSNKLLINESLFNSIVTTINCH